MSEPESSHTLAMTNVAHEFQRICVVGLGYVGLPTAAILASKGVDVIGVDVEPDRVETINSGASHIAEPDLEDLVWS